MVAIALAEVNRLSYPATPIIEGNVSLHRMIIGKRVKQNAKLEDLMVRTRIKFRVGAIHPIP